MTSPITRGRLLAGAALGVGLAVFTPTQAEAQCVVTPAGTPVTGTVTCADTTTTDTTYAGVSPADDREYLVNTSAGNVTGTVTTGEIVDGFGLAFTNTIGGANDLIIVNNGTIQVDAGAPVQGGSGALDITAIGGTNVDYSGDGDIIHLGTGDGLSVDIAGGGSFTGTTSGDISAAGGDAVQIFVADAGGIDFTSTGSISSTAAGAVFTQITSATGGDLILDVNDAAGDAGFISVFADSVSDTGNVSVTTNGDVTGGGGITARLNSGTATGDVTVISNGTVTADNGGIIANNSGAGEVSVTTVGLVDGGAGFGIVATSSGGPITVETGDVTAGTLGIDVDQTDAAGAGAISVTTNGVVTAATTAIDIDNAGTGPVMVAVDGSITADAGDAVAVTSTNAAAGAIDITTLAGETLAASGGDGITVSTAGTGDITITNAADVISAGGGANTLQYGIEAVASGGSDVFITNDGTIGTDTDRPQLSGIFSTATGAGTVNVDGSGDIFANVHGMDVSTSGTGAVTVNYDGAIDAAVGDGIQAASASGLIDITSGGAITAANTGIRATSTSGNVEITANDIVDGTTTGIMSTTTGTTAIAVGAAGDVTGGTQAILIAGTGDTTIDNAGIIGAASTDLAINVTGGANTTVNNAGVINGTMTFGAGADVLANTGDINTQGTIDFGGGVDDFSNDAGGAFNLAGDTTLANLETFSNDGLINLGTFTLTGPAIAFVNTGTIDTDGDAAVAGFTTFDNDGVLDLGPGTFTVLAGLPFANTGTILADEGASTITGQTVFNNSGTLDLQDGVTDDTLTIDSDFVGSGASTLAVDFSGTDADLLVINGDASGETAVDATYIGGGFNLDGLLVVDAVTSDDDAFVLGTVTGTPLIDVSLVQDGAEYFLITAPTAAAFNPLVVPGFAMDLWYQSADEIFAETVKPATTEGFSFWGEGYASRDKYGDDDDSVTIDGVDFDVDNRVKTKRHGIQLGADYGFDNGGRVGLSGGYAWADANGSDGANPAAKGWNLGVYGQYGGLTGFHAEFLAKYDQYDAEFEDGVFEGTDFDITSAGVDGAVGYRFGFGGMAMDAHAGISYVRTKIDDIDAFGFDYDLGKVTSTRGRAGLRAILGDSGWAPYIDGTVYHEFSGDGEVELFDGTNTYDLDTNAKGTWVRFEAGLSGNDGPGPILAAWADIGDRKGLGLRAGWRLGGRVAEALPPPPPPPAPPPPPPPATQTCPDGSVILATDACPPPPPPPPPPPEPERG